MKKNLNQEIALSLIMKINLKNRMINNITNSSNNNS